MPSQRHLKTTSLSRLLFYTSLLIFIFITGECNSLSLPSRLSHQHHQLQTHLLPVQHRPQEQLTTASSQQQTSYKFQVLENSKAGILVGQVAVRNHFEYQFIQDVKEFSLDSRTGVIKTTHFPTDRERQEVFHVIILATPSNRESGNHNNYSLSVDIEVLDVNDCRPSVTAVNSLPLPSMKDDLLEVRVSSQKITSLPDDLFVLGVKVYDCDSGSRSKVSFHLSDSSDRRIFNLDSETGVLRMTRSPPLDQNITSNLQVIVKDNSPTDALSSSLLLRVAILSLTETSDQLVQVPSSPKLVSETAKVNTIIHEFLPFEGEGDSLQMLILGGDPYAKFRFEGNMLLVNDSLDFEDVSSYELFIEVTRRTSVFSEERQSFQMIKLKIMIQNENDNYPEFESDSYTVSVPEEVSDPVMILQVVAHDKDLSQDEESEFLRFSINAQKDVTTSLPFKIDSSGMIWTTGKLDREEHDSYDLEVVVEDDQGFSSSCKVHVTVEDKNDNPPRFTRLFSTEISESAPRGSFVIQVTSSDRDADPSFTDASYSLLEDSDIFEIEPRSGKIFLVGSLDREVKDEYLLLVAANDSSWRAQTTVTIIVLDENDNSPVFEKSHYDFKKVIGEGSFSDSESRIFGRVRATDRDAGINGEVEYFLREGSSSSLWEINMSTGQLSLKTDPSSQEILMKEGKRSFNVTVTARDRGIPSLSSEASVTISLLTQESLEGVSSLLQTSDVKIPLPLDLKTGSVIHTLKSLDGVSLQATSSHDTSSSNLLRIIGNRIVFTGAGSLRLGSRHLFNVKSSLEDFNLTLVVVRPNLYAPMFSQKKYQLMIPENKNVSELLAPFQASDADVDEGNRNIVYSYHVSGVVWNERAIEYFERTFNSVILPSSAKTNEEINEYFLKKDIFPKIHDPFRLDSESGTLHLRNHLDYELIVSYRLVISAKDGAFFGSKNSTSIVIIHVSDINDNRPEFVNVQDIEQGLEVYENNLIGHIVGDVRAVDFDSLPNSQITFELEPTLDYQNFSISAKTGQIQTLISFDYEKRRDYSLKVVAKNDNFLKNSALIKVRVRDINELNDRMSPDGLSFGVVITLVFFVILILIISLTFLAWCKQKIHDKNDEDGNSHGPIYGSGSSMSMPRKMPTSSLPSMKDVPSNGMSLMPTPAHLAFNGGHHHAPKMMYPASSHRPPPPSHHLHHHHHLHAPPHLRPHESMMHSSSLGNQYKSTTGCPTPSSPDILENPSSGVRVAVNSSPGSGPQQRMIPPAPPSSTSFSDGMRPSCDNYSEILAGANEQYDLENASSIAPSDIDLAFMYKGYPPPLPPVHPHSIKSSAGVSSHHLLSNSENQGNSSSPGDASRQLPVPRERMSPSVSDLTSPRILTLQNLSSPSGQQQSLASIGQPIPGQRKMICTRRPETMTTVMSSDDDQNTVDSFTSSEYEETYKQLEQQQRQGNGMSFNRVW